jgi:two-component system, NarL family, response regulator DesR
MLVQCTSPTPTMPLQKRIRVLLVDDSDLTLHRTCSALRVCRRVEVVATATGSTDAVNLAREHQPDLVLMDVQQADAPRVDRAFEVMKELRFTRLVVVSDQDSVPIRRMCQKSGTHSLVPKTRFTQEFCGIVKQVAGECG